MLLSGGFALVTSFVFFLLPLYSYSGFRFSWAFKRNVWHVNINFKHKIHFRSKQWWIIWAVLIAIVVLAGIIFATVGPKNSIYKDGTFLYLTVLGNTDGTTNGIFEAIQKALGSNWTVSSANTSSYLSAISGADNTGQGVTISLNY